MFIIIAFMFLKICCYYYCKQTTWESSLRIKDLLPILVLNARYPSGSNPSSQG